jgi:serine/threonine protein kinase
VGRVASTNGLRAGAVLSGKFRVERVIGQGSMGIVLEATDLPLQRRVAVKVMSPERAHRDESRKRFLREARAAVRLSSEHVTRLIDVGELHDGTPYLVMEYLVGSTLEEVLNREGPPPVDVVVDWMLQTLDGVAEAHRAGFVHRDIKPENLFLYERTDRPPIVKVLDFGTVKDLVSKGTKLTRPGATMGSPAYMPPEQVRAEEIDARADVWAMGVTLYELLTGKLPFGGESVPQTLAAILRDEPIPLRQHRPEIPPALEALVGCALSKDRARRYASGTEMLGALSVIRQLLPTTPRVNRTVRLTTSNDLTPYRPEAFAETTDMNVLAFVEGSRIRQRVVTEQRAKLEQPLGDTTVPNTRKTRMSSAVPLLIAAIAATAIGGIVGAVVSRRHPRPPVHTVASTAPVSPATYVPVANAPNVPAPPPTTTTPASSSVTPTATTSVTPTGPRHPPARPHRPR